MNRIEANRLIVEIVILLVTGDAADKTTARKLAGQLKEADLLLLKARAEEAAILAEDVFFEKRRENRAKSKRV